MAEGRQEALPPVYSAQDIETTVWNRVLARVAALEKEGIATSNEDYSRLWQEEVHQIVAQIQHREQRNRERLKRYMRGWREDATTQRS